MGSDYFLESHLAAKLRNTLVDGSKVNRRKIEQLVKKGGGGAMCVFLERRDSTCLLITGMRCERAGYSANEWNC